MATASAGRAGKGSSQAPARSARPCSATASRSCEGRTQEALESSKNSPVDSRKGDPMTVYCDEPKTAAELIARYRDVKQRLYPIPLRRPKPDAPAVGAETIPAFALTAAVPDARARETGMQAEQAQPAVRLAGAGPQAEGPPTEFDQTGVLSEDHRQTQAPRIFNSAEPPPGDGCDAGPPAPRRSARAALRAVSERTSVPVDAILGRERRSEIAAARHEAIWRVHETTKWSLPRVGQFFGGRDHTTVLHSLRRMEHRAAEDPELRAYMDEVRRVCSGARASPC
jgi:hypothetical protein